MKSFLLLHLITACCLVGCASAPTNYQPFPLSDIQTDFPQSDTLKFKEFNTYDISDDGYVEVRDSILWAFNIFSEEHIGYCYNLYTKEKYSSIAAVGRAANELDNQYKHSLIANDSVYFLSSYTNTIKSIAQKDIITDVPLGERKFINTKLPDSLFIEQIVKLPNGSILATNSFNLRQKYPTISNEIKSPLIVIINKDNIKTYPVIDYNSHYFKMYDEHQLSRVDFIRYNYASGCISCRNNSIAVLSVNYQGILYTLDLTNGKVINEKRYSEMKCEGTSFLSFNDLNLEISQLESNDKYIFCIVSGYLNQIDKEEKRRKRLLLVFDWNLNPVKSFLLSYSSSYLFSKDNPYVVYERRISDKGLTLFKADLKF